MVQNISIACDATFGAGSENFGTVTGNVTFQNGSANSGTVTGNAVFEGNAENKAGATVTGNSTFDHSAVNNGTVSGSVTVLGAEYVAWLAANVGANFYGGQYRFGQWAWFQTEYPSLEAVQEVVINHYQEWLTSNVGVNRYLQPGQNIIIAHGTWAFNSTVCGSEEEGNALKAQFEESEFQTWLGQNVGLDVYEVNGVRFGTWAYNQTAYAGQLEAADGGHSGWLAANIGVNQWTEGGTYNGYWAYNQTRYSSEADARTAEYEAGFQAWLASNIGVNQYAVEGRFPRFAYNSTEYPSTAEAQAAYDAANSQ